MPTKQRARHLHSPARPVPHLRLARGKAFVQPDTQQCPHTDPDRISSNAFYRMNVGDNPAEGEYEYQASTVEVRDPASLRPRAVSATRRVQSPTLLSLAPILVASGYSWIRHTISESGAQGVEGAWVARLGFVLFGIAVWQLAQHSRLRWTRWHTFFFRTFAMTMIAVAVFSHKPWNPHAPFDAAEDVLHSIAATAMGFAVILGVLTRSLSRPRRHVVSRALDVLVAASGTAIPLAMLTWPDASGLLQRVMFGAAYVWFAHEALAPNPSNADRVP